MPSPSVEEQETKLARAIFLAAVSCPIYFAPAISTGTRKNHRNARKIEKPSKPLEAILRVFMDSLLKVLIV